jgi:signal transduction histidine kinase
MSLIARTLLIAAICAISAVCFTLWAASLALSTYWVNSLVTYPPPRMLAQARDCDNGKLPQVPLRFGQRVVDFYSSDTQRPARAGAPGFPETFATDARQGRDRRVQIGGLSGEGTMGYRRFAHAERCGIAVVRLTRSPLARPEIQLLGAMAALCAALASALGGYLIVARPLLRRVAETAKAAGQVGAPAFFSAPDMGWSDLEMLDQNLKLAHDRIVGNERALAQRAAEVEALLSAIAHDLKTPLAIIQLNLQQAALADVPSPSQHIARALVEVQHASALLENLELGAQLEGDDLAAALGPVDLTTIVAGSAERFALLGAGRGLTVEAAWPDAPLWVHGDETLFTRIISNLVHNALRHSGGRNVAIVLAGHARTAQLRIVDDGIGIPPEARTALTLPDNASMGLSIGERGRGLPIVMRLCVLLRINILIEAGSGEGTRILMEIPLLEDGPAPNFLKESQPLSAK